MSGDSGLVLRVGDAGVPALHTAPGGPPVHLDLGPVLVSKASVSEQDNNAYVLTARDGGGQVLVDAADDAAAVLALADASAAVAHGGRRDVRRVVTTHGHRDHHRALPDVVTALGLTVGTSVLVGRDDAGDLPVGGAGLLDHGDVVAVPGLHLDVVHLRGHTPGSVALVLPGTADHPPVAVTGDSLFPGGVGNTWQDAARFASLLADVTARLFDALPDGTVVLPGHGDGTTLGAERPSLPVWRERGW